MIPPPPISTLFPYTTLFRSFATAVSGSVFPHGSVSTFPLTATTGDRKSTRLNSSHEWISYAVFCLKKKILMRSCRPRQTQLDLRHILPLQIVVSSLVSAYLL